MSRATCVYLSGPMTGLPALNFPAFHSAADALRARGWTVISPAEINPDGAITWHEAMRNDIRALCDCTHLALLPGWEDSQGAHLEVHLAHRLGIRVRRLEEML